VLITPARPGYGLRGSGFAETRLNPEQNGGSSDSIVDKARLVKDHFRGLLS
jgi:hypothetical protein